jgi:hypothetical protein
MEKPITVIHDVATGETIEREMTDEEFEAYEALIANSTALPDPD